jgi:hypothetical protein
MVSAAAFMISVPDQSVSTSSNADKVDVFHISLTSLEHLHRQHRLAHPFNRVATLRSKNGIKHAVMEEIDGEPYLVAIVGMSSIVFKNLAYGSRFTLKCCRWMAYGASVSGHATTGICYPTLTLTTY